MGKFNRIKAIFLSLCIIISLFSGMGAMASEDVFLSWDADLDFISLTFSEDIDISALEDATTLTKDGQKQDIVVELNRHADTDEANRLSANDVSKLYTYTITPLDGMVEDEIYTLTIAPCSVFEEEFTKSFAVKILDTGLELGNKADKTWSYASGNNGNISSMTNDEDGNLVAQVVMNGYKNGRYARHYPTYAVYDTSVKDYTVKLTYNPAGNASTTYYRLYSHMSVSSGANSLEYALYNQNGGTKRLALKHGSTALAGADTFTITDGKNTPPYSEISPDDTIELKLAVRNGVAIGYINGTKVLDAKIPEGLGGKAGFNLSASGADSAAAETITLSNYVMTQVVEYYTAEIDKTENLELTDSVKITLPKAVADSFNPESYAVLTKDGEEVSDYSAVLSEDGTYVTVSFAGLEHKTGYDITFPEYSFADGTKAPIIPVSFTTLAPDYDLDSFVLTDANGEKLGSMAELTTDTFSVSARVINNRLEDAKTATVTVAVYNNLGQMCAISGNIYTLAKGEYADIEIEDFECKYGETYTAKCFVWESFADMTPIFEECIE